MLYYRLLTLILFDSETLSVNIGLFGLKKYALLSSTDTNISVDDSKAYLFSPNMPMLTERVSESNNISVSRR